MENNVGKWDEKSVLALINNNAEESIKLEFKSAEAFDKSDGKKKEISKDVSAFANSDGGTIIYGIKEINHIASELSFIDGNIFTKEWLEHTIQNNIQRRIDGLEINPVRFNNDTTKTIYVVEIPRSTNAPHISKDKRYYKRYNFESVPMEEYEVRDVYSRKQNTTLKTSHVTHKLVETESWERERHIKTEISITINNDGNFVSNQYKVICRFYGMSEFGISYERNESYIVTNTKEFTTISTTSFIPIFPKEHLTVLKFTITISDLYNIDKDIYYEISVYDSEKIISCNVDLKEILSEWHEIVFGVNSDNLPLLGREIRFVD